MRTIEIQLFNSALLNRDSLFKIMQHDDLFLSADIAAAHSVVRELYEISDSIDLPSLHAAINNHPLSKIIKPDNLIGELATAGMCFNPDFIIDQLLEVKRRANLQDIAKDLYRAAQDKTLSYDDMYSRLMDISSERVVKSASYVDLADFASGTLDDIFEKHHYTKSGFPSLDEKLNGFFDGSLNIIAARPGNGKTTLALQIAHLINEPVLFFSLEMKRHELFAKLLSMGANVESWRVMAKRLEIKEIARVESMRREYARNLKITVFDGGINFASLVFLIGHFAKFKKPRMIVIDYLQLITGAPGHNDNERVSAVSRELKLLAMRYNLPIICLSQMSRLVEREKREPVLSDLRDSGSIEQDANVVIFLHKTEDGTLTIVAKNRMGRVGKISTLYFNKEFSRFEDTTIPNVPDWTNEG